LRLVVVQLLKNLSLKSKDLDSFTINVTTDALPVGKALLNLGPNINQMPLSMMKRIGNLEVQPTKMTLQVAYRKINHPYVWSKMFWSS